MTSDRPAASEHRDVDHQTDEEAWAELAWATARVFRRNDGRGIARENLPWRADEIRALITGQGVPEDHESLAVVLCQLTQVGHGDYKAEALRAWRDFHHARPQTDLEKHVDSMEKNLAAVWEEMVAEAKRGSSET